jgi:hypothetical protein
MQAEYCLEDLSYLELTIMLQHLRLGLNHLKQHLEPKQLYRLLLLGQLGKQQKENIAADPAEKAGNLALVLNTIITSVFGAWMGLSGFIGFNLGSMLALACIVIIATLISGFIGYQSFKLTKAQAASAMTQQRLNNLQLKVLDLIQTRRLEAIKKIIAYLNQTVVKINQNLKDGDHQRQLPTSEFTTKDEIFSWLKKLNGAILEKIKQHRTEEIYQIYIHELNGTRKRLKHILSKNLEISEDFSEKTCHKTLQTNGSFIKILTDPTLITAKKTITKHSWYNNNIKAITVGLAPTILGGFASMFVFLGGAPSVSNALQLHQVEALLTSLPAKIIEFTMAVCLTIYFGYSHLYTNRKGFERKQELEHAQKLIVNQEKSMIELNVKLNMLLKVKQHLRKIKDMFIMLSKISHFLENEQAKLAEYAKAIKKLQAALQQAGVAIDEQASGELLSKIRDYQDAAEDKAATD